MAIGEGLAGADALLIVDMQRGFIRPGMWKLVENVHRLTKIYPAEKTWWLKYRNTPDSLFARHLDWQDMMVPPRTDIVEPLVADPDRTFVHFSYLLPDELLNLFQGLKTVALAGVDTDACVYAACFSLWQRGIRPLILADHCGSSDGEQFHRAALDMIRRQFGVGAIIYEDK